MRNHPTRKPHRPSHVLLGAVLVACALAMMHWPSMWPAIGSVAGISVAIHAGVAVAIHVGVGLAGTGILIGALRSHARAHRNGHGGPGATLRWPRFYDWLTAAHSFGREARMRERTLDAAGVAAGEHVLDVGCGTGTLALAAKRRVGASGSVHGVDAATEMIAYAKTKAARSGLPVALEVAAAQSLPFADAMFDVVLFTLALHHLPEDARAGALAEMRRVLKPEGRALIVEFSREHGVRAALNPFALLHACRNPRMLDDAVALMKRAGFERIVTGPLGFSGMGYVLARRD
jgi:SAM-dependent methyltransferase